MSSDRNIKLILENNKCLREEVEVLKGVVSKISMNSNSVNKEITKGIQKIIKDDKKISYAESVKSNEPVVIIVPKNSEQKSEATKAEIKNKISPTAIKISGIQNASKGAIVVECKNKEASAKLMNEAVAKLGDKYDINIPLSKNPRFKIVNTCDKLSAETIISNIKRQNEFVNNDAEFKIIKIIEADVSSYESI